MRFYLKDFCIFISVAETGSLSKTSAIMGLSISSVSKRLARLEEHLQTTLFERNARGVRLSPLGKEAYLKSKEITTIFSSFIDDIRGSKVQQLNIQVEKKISPMPFMDWIYDYAANSSHLSVNYESRRHIRNQPLHINDIIISPYKSTWPLAIHRRLEPVRRKVFASTRVKEDFSVESLKSKNVIFYHLYDNEEPSISNSITGENLLLTPVISTDDLFQIANLSEKKEIIIAGLPEYLSRKFVNQGLIYEVLPEWSARSMQIYLIWKDRKHYNDEFNSLLEALMSEFSGFINGSK